MLLKTKQKLYDSAEVYNWRDGNKNNLRTIEAQIVQNLKNNEDQRSSAKIYWFLLKKRVFEVRRLFDNLR